MQYGAEPFEQQQFETAGVEAVNCRLSNWFLHGFYKCSANVLPVIITGRYSALTSLASISLCSTVSEQYKFSVLLIYTQMASCVVRHMPKWTATGDEHWLTKLDGLLQLHPADNNVVIWLTFTIRIRNVKKVFYEKNENVKTLNTRAHQHMRYPNVTWRIILYGYLFTTELWHTCRPYSELFLK